MWTLFWDMHSGGYSKEVQDKIYIEETSDVATRVFYNRFGHNPNRVTCTCCGADYAIDEYKTLEEASEYHRKNLTVEQYITQPNVLVIYAKDIKPEEHTGELPRQGYVWID